MKTLAISAYESIRIGRSTAEPLFVIFMVYLHHEISRFVLPLPSVLSSNTRQDAVETGGKTELCIQDSLSRFVKNNVSLLAEQVVHWRYLSEAHAKIAKVTRC